jgi:hypothetical protein
MARDISLPALLDPVADLDDRIDGRKQPAPELGQRVLDRRWRGRFRLAGHEAVGRQPSQPRGQDLRAECIGILNALSCELPLWFEVISTTEAKQVYLRFSSISPKTI